MLQHRTDEEIQTASYGLGIAASKIVGCVLQQTPNAVGERHLVFHQLANCF
jgi:hypothetical protein